MKTSEKSSSTSFWVRAPPKSLSKYTTKAVKIKVIKVDMSNLIKYDVTCVFGDWNVILTQGNCFWTQKIEVQKCYKLYVQFFFISHVHLFHELLESGEEKKREEEVREKETERKMKQIY